MTLSVLMAISKLLTELFAFFYICPLQSGLLEPAWKGEEQGGCSAESTLSAVQCCIQSLCSFISCSVSSVPGVSLGTLEICLGAHLGTPKTHRAGTQPCPGRVSADPNPMGIWSAIAGFP